MNRHFFLALLLLVGTTAQAPPAPAAPAPAATVHIKDDAYKPASLTIHSGDTVLFVNDDDDAHTVTANDNAFDSKGLDTNQRWQYTFTKPGTYAYFCEMHPFMKATIVVKAVNR